MSPKKRLTQATSRQKNSVPRERLIDKVFDRLFNNKQLVMGLMTVLLGILFLLSIFDKLVPETIVGLFLKLNQVAGKGTVLVGLFLIVFGAQMIFRGFGKEGGISGRILFGMFFLVLAILLLIQLFTASDFDVNSLLVVQEARGGGWIGYFLLRVMGYGFGRTGGLIVLIAWMVLAVGLILNMSMSEMLHVFDPAREQIGQSFTTLRYRLFPSKEEVDFEPAYPDPRMQKIFVEDAEEVLEGDNQHMQTDRTQKQVFRPMPPQQPASVLSANQTNYSGFTWELPDYEAILQSGVLSRHDEKADLYKAEIIENTLNDFGVPAKVVEIHRGPNVTQFCVKPGLKKNSKGVEQRVRIGKITSRADDLALVLASRSLRIQAPVRGKGYLGIEVPNNTLDKVTMRDIIETEAFEKIDSPLRFTVGKDVAGNAIVTDLAKMPHLLIAGATNSGKSVALNAIISCMLLFNTPDELRFIMVDPKRVELTGYDGIPHLLNPVIIEPEKATRVLRWATQEMDRRYLLLKQLKARNIVEFNEKAKTRGIEMLPYIVIVIDELADLMILAREQIEAVIIHLAKKARSAGIHLILSTQRPSVDVLTGLIKSNISSRISFAVASGVDSQVILDQSGAEHLLGKGDMLFKRPNHFDPVRIQGVFLSDEEITNIVDYWRGALRGGGKDVGIQNDAPPAVAPQHIPLKQLEMFKVEGETNPQELKYQEAVKAVRHEGKASTSWLQRKIGIGYNRAAKFIERMEKEGIISAPMGNTYKRDILDYGEERDPSEEIPLDLDENLTSHNQETIEEE